MQLSISPSSILCPLIFTWLSFLEIKLILPSSFHLAKSPVLYAVLLLKLSGNFIKLLSVSSLLFKYPFPTLSPVIYNSPGVEIGTGFKFLSSINNFKLFKGIPIGMILYLFKISSFKTIAVEQIVVSVGP